MSPTSNTGSSHSVTVATAMLTPNLSLPSDTMDELHAIGLWPRAHGKFIEHCEAAEQQARRRSMSTGLMLPKARFCAGLMTPMSAMKSQVPAAAHMANAAATK